MSFYDLLVGGFDKGYFFKQNMVVNYFVLEWNLEFI